MTRKVTEETQQSIGMAIVLSLHGDELQVMEELKTKYSKLVSKRSFVSPKGYASCNAIGQKLELPQTRVCSK